MSQIKRAAVYAAVVLNILILLIVMTSAGSQCRGKYPIRLNDIPSPEGTVEQFFRCIKLGDFDGADALAANCRTLGLEPETYVSDSDVLSSYIKEHLYESYAIESVDSALPSPSDVPVTPSDVWMNSIVISNDDYTISGDSAVVTVRYTYLDSGKLTERLAALSRKLGKKQAEKGVAVDNDEAAFDLFDKAVKKLAKDDCRKYYSTTDLEIELTYTDGSWHITITPELYDALCGRPAIDSDEENVVSPTELNGGGADE